MTKEIQKVIVKRRITSKRLIPVNNQQILNSLIQCNFAEFEIKCIADYLKNNPNVKQILIERS